MRFFLTSIGIAIGAMAIVILVSFGAGIQKTSLDLWQDTIQAQEITVSGDSNINSYYNLNLGATEKGTILALNERTIESFKEMSGVEDVYSTPSFSADLSYGDKIVQLYSSGLRPIKYTQNSFKQSIKYGNTFTTDNEDSIILTYDIFKVLGFDNPREIIGKNITIDNFNDFLASPSAHKVEFIQKKYVLTVVGIYDEKQSNYMSVLPNLTAVRINNELKNDEYKNSNPFLYDSLTIRVTNINNIQSIKDDLQKQGYGTTSLDDIVKYINQVTLIMQSVLAVVGSISLLVASIGVVNTMFIAVLERTKEIGINKAIGATDGDIMRIYIFESMIIGLFGGLLGILIGIIGSKLTELLVEYFLKSNGATTGIQFYVPRYLIVFVLIFTILICVVAGLVPARRAAKIDPIISLRDD
jgi:putative ABC transport system permease protein